LKILFSKFVSDFPEILNDFSRAQLRQMIVNGALNFKDDVDPVININEVKEGLKEKNAEIEYFFKSAPIRLKSFIDYFKSFPFKIASNKSLIRKALLTIYGQDAPEPEKAAESTLDKELTDITEDTPSDIKSPETKEEKEEESLPPDLEDEAVNTLNGYLQKDVFNNKIIPVVKIVEAYKLQNGYIVTFELASLDKTKKVYTSAVIYNDKLVLPAEIRDENDAVIGEFNKDVILDVFAETEGKMPTESDNYQDLLNEMIKTKSPETASKILDKIIQKFGAEVGRNAFDTFTRIKYKKYNTEPIGVANRLDVRLATDLINFEFEDYDVDKSELDKMLKKFKEDK